MKLDWATVVACLWIVIAVIWGFLEVRDRIKAKKERKALGIAFENQEIRSLLGNFAVELGRTEVQCSDESYYHLCVYEPGRDWKALFHDIWELFPNLLECYDITKDSNNIEGCYRGIRADKFARFLSNKNWHEIIVCYTRDAVNIILKERED